MDLPVWAAVLISVVSLALGWVIYDQLCKSRLGANTALLCALGFVFLVAASWGYTQVFSGRGAYIHAGALIGTIMVANVFFVIIPNQKIVVADLIAGRTPDPALGRAGQATLAAQQLPDASGAVPDDQQPLSAELRGALELADRGGRDHRRRGHPPLLQHAPCGQAEPLVDLGGRHRGHGAGGVAERGRAGRWRILRPIAGAATAPVTFAEVENIVLSRCSMCHAAEPFWEGIAAPPKGVRLDTPEMIRKHAPRDPAPGDAHPRHAARQHHRDLAR